MTGIWKSPRLIELEVATYRRKRFEDYMVRVDMDDLPLAIACLALREEIEYQDSVTELAEGQIK